MTGPARSAVILGLALAGLAIAGYLAAFQLGLVATVADPVFGSGSERVLTSAVSRALPVPDAVLGAAGYALDLVLAAIVAATSSRAALRVLTVVALLGAGVAVVLVVLQPLVAGAWCLLCLSSAAISIALAGVVVAESRAGRSVARPATLTTQRGPHGPHAHPTHPTEATE